jgi:arylsulfatase A-like enzyme
MNWMQRHRAEELDNTWFVFTSDHGDMQGDHHLWRKTYAYEGSARIPFLVIPPRQQGKPHRPVADEVVELRDVLPTVLKAAGVRVPETVDGRSVLPLMNGTVPDWRDYIHGEHCTCYSREQEMHYVTDGKRKFVWLPRLGIEQFFNLDDDPGEETNLVADPACLREVEIWRGYLTRELADRDCGWVKDGKPFCPGDEPLISPYKEARWGDVV